MAFALGVFLLLVVALSVYLGRDVPAIITGLAFLGIMISSFLKNK
jgi:small-conductance mechanosensitive channel